MLVEVGVEAVTGWSARVWVESSQLPVTVPSLMKPAWDYKKGIFGHIGSPVGQPIQMLGTWTNALGYLVCDRIDFARDDQTLLGSGKEIMSKMEQAITPQQASEPLDVVGNFIVKTNACLREMRTASASGDTYPAGVYVILASALLSEDDVKQVIKNYTDARWKVTFHADGDKRSLILEC